MSKTKRWIINLSAIFGLVVVDQIIKMIVRMHTDIFSISIISDFFSISYFENNGDLTTTTTAMVVEILIVTIFRFTQYKNIDLKTGLALSMITAGGMANLIDIITRKSITDYISITSFNMNIADFYTIIGWICFGIFVFGIKIMREENMEEKVEENCKK